MGNDLIGGIAINPTGGAPSPFYNVLAYGADPTGTKDSTVAIQAAINACGAAGGGKVFCPVGVYLTSDTLVLLPGVSFMGSMGMVQLTTSDNSIYGTIFRPTNNGAFDFLSHSPSQNIKGSEIGLFAIDGAVGSNNWLIRLYQALGCYVHGIGARSGLPGNNFFTIDGGSGGAFGNLIKNLSCATGYGYKGGVGFQLGSAADTANANTLVGLTALGYAKGLSNANGGGNTYVGAWMQSCGIGVELDSSESTIKGGWFESNTKDVVFGSNSINNVVSGLRAPDAGGLTVTPGGSGNKIRDCDGFGIGPQAAPAIPASGTALTNPFPFDVTVYVSGGTVTAIAVGGTATGLTSGAISVPAGETITLTYSVAPTWVWIGH